VPRWLREPVLAVASLEEAARARAAAWRVSEGLTWRRLLFTAAVVAAFAIPFAAGALGGEQAAPAPAAVLEPPAVGAAPEPPALSAVPALPEPPARVRRRPRPAAPPPAPAPAQAPAAVATPAPPTPAPAPVVQAPAAPAPAPAPEPPVTFDIEG